ncbi:MAG TPA: hypothetical protein VF263_00375 [Longimicrobiaceae bacterium]
MSILASTTMRTNRPALPAAVAAVLAIAACSPQPGRSDTRATSQPASAAASAAAHRPPPLPTYLDVPDGAVALTATPITTASRIRAGAVRGGPYTLIRGDADWTRLWAAGAPGVTPPPMDFRTSSVIALRVADGDRARDAAPEVYSSAGTTYVVLEEGRYPPYQGPATRIELFRIPTSNGPVGRIGFRPADTGR